MTGAKFRRAQLSMKIFRWVRRSFKLSRLNTLIRVLDYVEFLPGDRYVEHENDGGHDIRNADEPARHWADSSSRASHETASTEIQVEAKGV